jgi:hypothetical protein
MRIRVGRSRRWWCSVQGQGIHSRCTHGSHRRLLRRRRPSVGAATTTIRGRLWHGRHAICSRRWRSTITGSHGRRWWWRHARWQRRSRSRSTEARIGTVSIVKRATAIIPAAGSCRGRQGRKRKVSGRRRRMGAIGISAVYIVQRGSWSRRLYRQHVKGRQGIGGSSKGVGSRMNTGRGHCSRRCIGIVGWRRNLHGKAAHTLRSHGTGWQRHFAGNRKGRSSFNLETSNPTRSSRE